MKKESPASFRGLFRYDLTACETKVIPGQFGFIAQLNEGAILRRGQRSFELIRFSSPLMAASLTSLKLNKRRFCSSLKPAKMRGSCKNAECNMLI
ncbi:unnamed protein product [Malus baccata var. baccata]